MSNTFRRRAYVYLTRRGSGGLEVAIFRHPDETLTFVTQTPGGTIEPSETPEAGALREAFEESGLDNFAPVRLLAKDICTLPTEREERFFYQFEASSPTFDV